MRVESIHIQTFYQKKHIQTHLVMDAIIDYNDNQLVTSLSLKEEES